MGKIKLISLVVFIGLNTSTMAQNIIRTGLLKAYLTVSPSYMFEDKQSQFYLHGNLEGYLNKNLSIAGEGYYYLGSLSSGESQFDDNHSTFFGALWHFTKKNNDLYIGIEPGLSFTRLSTDENNLTNSTMGVNPLFSTVIGYNYFVHTIFHFFLQSRIILGGHHYDLHKSLSEFRFSAGLGFNLNTIKN